MSCRISVSEISESAIVLERHGTTSSVTDEAPRPTRCAGAVGTALLDRERRNRWRPETRHASSSSRVARRGSSGAASRSGRIWVSPTASSWRVAAARPRGRDYRTGGGLAGSRPGE